MADAALLNRLAAIKRHLGPHAALLLDEMLIAAQAGLHATVIVQSCAILDVILREPTGKPASADGIDLAVARDSRDAFWLRERRNGIVHYEGGRGGLMAESDADRAILSRDADRALHILIDAIDLLLWGVD
jgi:hypothetical protein